MMKNFIKNSFIIVDAEKIELLAELKKKIYIFSCKELSLKKISIDFFYKNFHKLKISKLRLNKYRLKLLKFLTSNVSFKKNIYDSFSKILTKILGPDVAIQKSLNVVIHQPDNLEISPMHRDAPENSPYEIVLWVPLVDCYDTKSIYLLNKKNTDANLKHLDNKNKKINNYLNEIFKTKGKLPKIKFGQAVIFWAGLLHTVPKNLENETRWTFNIRLKNLFSPYGRKGFLDYHEVFKKSHLTKLGLDFEKKRY
jgi:sporadic carbohydrate cluster 2OG-Fe(II) oxygenase